MYPAGASPVGALDLAGNVWEWCLNRHYQPSDVSLAGGGARVLRGGSFNFTRGSARCALRFWFQPGYRVSYVGLRVVLRSPPVPSL